MIAENSLATGRCGRQAPPEGDDAGRMAKARRVAHGGDSPPHSSGVNHAEPHEMSAPGNPVMQRSRSQREKSVARQVERFEYARPGCRPRNK